MLVKTSCSALVGIEAQPITIETFVGRGMKFFLVGLPDNSIKESYRRIRSALQNHGYRIPGKEITVSLAPADLRKEGSYYDLPIALTILAATEQVEQGRLDELMVAGELSLDGTLKPVKGVLSMAIAARDHGCKAILLPKANAEEAAVVEGLEVLPAENLQQAIAHLKNEGPSYQPQQEEEPSDPTQDLCLSEVKGQEFAKRALEIAAAGGHNLIMIGPPGSGKSMLASRLPGIMPPMSFEEALESTRVHSVVGRNEDKGLLKTRPYRKPHHTISDVALVGGGGYPQPGEISLAHNGVLFLDELPEFKRTVLEVMRQPLEDRVVTISRARFSADFPASFILVAAMNPCPCGYHGHPGNTCTCSGHAVHQYMSRISGPLMDRIDLHVFVEPVKLEALQHLEDGETTTQVRARVIQAATVQRRRLKGTRLHNNAHLQGKLLDRHCQMTKEAGDLLIKAMDRLGLSARAYDRIRKVSRTIADLEGEELIGVEHVSEAIQFRSLDRRRSAA